MRFKDLLPEFYGEVERLFLKLGRDDLMGQLSELEIVGRCGCGDSFCSTFYVKGGREINVVEKNVVGSCHKECIELEAERGTIIVDIDNFGCIVGFEVLDREDVEYELVKIKFDLG